MILSSEILRGTITTWIIPSRVQNQIVPKPSMLHIDEEDYHAYQPLNKGSNSVATHPQCCRRFGLLHGITKGERKSTKSCMLLSYILIEKISLFYLLYFLHSITLRREL